MDHPRKNSGKDQIKNYFIDSESKTEDYETSLKKQQENQIKDKSFLRKKRYSKEKVQKKKSPFLKRETTKIHEKRKNINTEKKRYTESENPFQLQSLNNQNERMKYLEEMVQKLIEQSLLYIQQKLEEQNFKLEELKFKLEEQKLAQRRLELDNLRLQKSFNRIISIENNLLIKMNLLQDQVQELNEFHFQVKLRKFKKINRISI